MEYHTFLEFWKINYILLAALIHPYLMHFLFPVASEVGGSARLSSAIRGRFLC